MPKLLRSVLAVVSVSFSVSIQLASAGPLTEAQVTKVINHVSLVDPRNGERPAAVRDVVKDDLGLETGVKSRSELLFQDNTLTRLGAETFFSFKTGTRDLTLEKGSMLLQVPKGLGGAKIHTAAVTAAITGTTIMMEYVPTKYIKVLVLEGSLRLSRNGLFGDSVVLTAGKMVIMRPDAKNIPDPVNVDIQHVVETSTLVNFPGADPLPSTNLIQAAIEQQRQQVANTNLVRTNLVIGNGTNVIVATNDQLAKLTGNLTGAIAAPLTTTPVALVKNDILPAVNNTTSAVTSTLGSTVGTVTTLLDSTTTALPATTTQLLATTTSAVTSIPISSTTQVTSLLDTAVPSATGTLAVAPSLISPIASTVPGTVTGTTSTVTSATTSIVNAITTSVPTSLATTPTTTSTPVPTTTLATTATTTVTSLLGHH